MPSCKQVTVMVSESLDGKILSWRERIKLKIHLSMCKACQRMVRQMALLRTSASLLGITDENEAQLKQQMLSQEASDRICAHLRKAQHDAGDDR
jgi:predicted anti-sigma-YlaC factor YlaD